jgi:hypothetical protein
MSIQTVAASPGRGVVGCSSVMFKCSRGVSGFVLNADLRYHPEHHVRSLAAETFGFLLRVASRKSLRAGMRALLAEHAGTSHRTICLPLSCSNRSFITLVLIIHKHASNISPILKQSFLF